MIVEMTIIFLFAGFYLYMVAFVADDKFLFDEMEICLRSKNHKILIKEFLIMAIRLQIDVAKYDGWVSLF